MSTLDVVDLHHAGLERDDGLALHRNFVAFRESNSQVYKGRSHPPRTSLPKAAL